MQVHCTMNKAFTFFVYIIWFRETGSRVNQVFQLYNRVHLYACEQHVTALREQKTTFYHYKILCWLFRSMALNNSLSHPFYFNVNSNNCSKICELETETTKKHLLKSSSV